jgi:hypothetical protein
LQMDPTTSSTAITYMVIFVGLRLLNRMRDVVGEDAVHQRRSEDAGHRPGSEQQAVDRNDIARAENVLEISRDGGEAAAIHAEDNAVGDDEQRNPADPAVEGTAAYSNVPSAKCRMIQICLPQSLRSQSVMAVTISN